MPPCLSPKREIVIAINIATIKDNVTPQAVIIFCLNALDILSLKNKIEKIKSDIYTNKPCLSAFVNAYNTSANDTIKSAIAFTLSPLIKLYTNKGIESGKIWMKLAWTLSENDVATVISRNVL